MKLSTVLLPSLAAAVALPAAAPSAPARTLVSPEVYADIIHYANYSATYANAPCQKPPPGSVVQGYANNQQTQTGVTLFRHDGDKELILAFPGSASLQDFLTDFTFFPVNYTGCVDCKVHSGFFRAWNSIANDTQALVDAAIAKYPSYTVSITGHSLGGALVNLAFATLKSCGYKIFKAHSFGEPRVGNKNYADYIDQLAGASDSQVGMFRRVTHANDGVPRLPPKIAGFQHHRTEFWADNDSLGKTSAANKTYQCTGQEASNCNDGTLGIFINAAHIFYPGINVVGCGF